MAGFWFVLAIMGMLVLNAGNAQSETILRLKSPEIGTQINEELEKKSVEQALQETGPKTSPFVEPQAAPPSLISPSPAIQTDFQTERKESPFPEEASQDPLIETVGPIVDPEITPDPQAPMAVEDLSEEELDELYAEVEAQAAVNVWDPFEDFNRDMYAFNDTLNNWLLSPLSTLWSYVIPEEIRMVLHNFFYNLTAPKRILNCLFQGNFRGAGVELGRFAVNTVMGLGGFGDIASAIEPLKQTYDADTDQTFGRYDVLEGPYIVLPVLNFFTFRSLVGMGVDTLMHPFTYVQNAGLALTGATAIRLVNDASFRLGAYETLRDASIDPYATFRDAYVQYRRKKAQEAKDFRSVSGAGIPSATRSNETNLFK